MHAASEGSRGIGRENKGQTPEQLARSAMEQYIRRPLFGLGVRLTAAADIAEQMQALALHDKNLANGFGTSNTIMMGDMARVAAINETIRARKTNPNLRRGDRYAKAGQRFRSVVVPRYQEAAEHEVGNSGPAVTTDIAITAARQIGTDLGSFRRGYRLEE